MPIPDRKPDAILSPGPPDLDRWSKHPWFRDHLYGLLSAPPGVRVGAKEQGQMSLIAPVEATLLYPTLHPLAGRERYDWYVVAEDTRLNWLVPPVPVETWSAMPTSVKFGYLRDEAAVDPMGADERAEFAAFVARRNALYAELAARRDALAADLDRTDEEQAEMEACERKMLDLADLSFGRAATAGGLGVGPVPKWLGG